MSATDGKGPSFDLLQAQFESLARKGKRRWRERNAINLDVLSSVPSVAREVAKIECAPNQRRGRTWDIVDAFIESAILALDEDDFSPAALESFGFTDPGKGDPWPVDVRDEKAAKKLQQDSAGSARWYRNPNPEYEGQTPRNFVARLVAASYAGHDDPENFVRAWTRKTGQDSEKDGVEMPPIETPRITRAQTNTSILDTDWLQTAEAKFNREFGALSEAFARSRKLIHDATAAFRVRLANCDSVPLDIVVCGSIGRDESSGPSDFDYLIVAHGLITPTRTLRTYRLVCDSWCEDENLGRPGNTGLFGEVVSALELVDRIGLDGDSNKSTTRRILLLEEARSVLRPELHRSFVDAALDRYLSDDNVSPDSVPRFLLNDIQRYWHTVAVDYQAKAWARLDTQDWALRYLKLRVTRKLTFAGSLAPLVAIPTSPGRPGSKEELRAHLTDQFVRLPPLGRIVKLSEQFSDDTILRTAVRDILVAANEFNQLAASDDWRDAIKSLSSHQAALDSRQFNEGNEIARSIEQALERLFFDSPSLQAASRKNLVF